MSDAKNITLVGASGEAAAFVKERFVIPHLMDAARLGMAYALREGLEADAATVDGPTIHNYHVATIDDEGLLVSLVQSLRPEDERAWDEPYRLIEVLMNVGLRTLEKDLKEGRVHDLGDLLTLGSSASRPTA